MTVYLALCIFVLLDAESCFCHCFLYHTNRIWTLIGWIDAFLGDKCGNFFPEGCKVVVSFLLSYLHFALLKDLNAREFELEHPHGRREISDFFDNFGHICFSKSLLQIAALSDFTLRHVHKDIADLHDIIQVCFSVKIILSSRDQGCQWWQITRQFSILELCSCNMRSTITVNL